MGKAQRPILFDADAIINLLEWGCYGKLCRALGNNACVADAVRGEVKYYVDRVTRRRRRFNSSAITTSSVPRLVTIDELSDEQYATYLRHFRTLAGAHAGERETVALAWVLEYDVCVFDKDATDLFNRHKPPGCPSRHTSLLDLLRSLRLIQ